jgi:hypothetical protein
MNILTNHVYTNSCVWRALMSMPLVKNILKIRNYSISKICSVAILKAKISVVPLTECWWNDTCPPNCRFSTKWNHSANVCNSLLLEIGGLVSSMLSSNGVDHNWRAKLMYVIHMIWAISRIAGKYCNSLASPKILEMSANNGPLNLGRYDTRKNCCKKFMRLCPLYR